MTSYKEEKSGEEKNVTDRDDYNRSSYLKKHRRENLRTYIIQLNNYFEDNHYLRYDLNSDLNIIQTIIDLYDENKDIDVQTAIPQIVDRGQLLLYQVGYEKMMQICEILDRIPRFRKMKRLPGMIAETIAKLIEIQDLSQKPKNASIHNVNKLLDELYIRLENIRTDLKVIYEEVRQLKTRFSKQSRTDRLLFRKHDKLSPKECKILEKASIKWMEDFIAMLNST